MSASCRILLATGAPDSAERIAAELTHADLGTEYRHVHSLAALEDELARANWDVVLCDSSLGSRAALLLARRHAPDVPFIVVCDRIGEEAAAELVREGARDVVSRDHLNRIAQVVARELADAGARQGRGGTAAADDATAQRLREREARYRRIIDTAAEGIWELDADGLTSFVNARMAEMLGRTSEELLGRPPSDFMFEEDVPDHEHRMQRRRRDMAERYERRFRRKDGHTLWVLIATTPVFEQGRFRGAFAVVTDISERKRAEDTLRTREQLLTTLLGNIPDHVTGFDRHGRVLFVNRPVIGPDPDSDIGRTSAELGRAMGSAAAHPRLFESLMRAIRGGIPSELETIWQTDKGQRVFEVRHVPVKDETGEITSAIGIARDITDRKRADSERERLLQDVEQERARLSVVLNTAPVGIGLFLAPDGRVALLNHAAEELLAAPDGRSATAPELQRDARLPSGEPFPAEALPLRRALRGESVHGVELVVRHPSGRELHLVENSAPVRDSQGAIVGGVLTLQDVSAVRELDRLRDEFLAAVAHELQTPVTSMAAYAELLARRTQRGDARTSHAITVIQNQAHRIGRRVQEMAEVSRLQRGSTLLTTRRFDLGELAAHAVSDLRQSSKANVTLRREYPVPVQGDAERIEDAVRTLLELALPCSSDGGDVDVRVWCNQDEAFVSVRDHGPGIPRDRQPHVFEPFYEAAPPGARGYRGVVPLSPYLSRLTIQRHKGRIWLESEEGQGTTFYFSLPLARVTVEQPAALAP